MLDHLIDLSTLEPLNSEFFLSRLNCLLLRGFPLMRGFYVVKNPLVKPSLSINEGFSTIEGSTIEGFRCVCIHWVQADITALEFE